MTQKAKALSVMLASQRVPPPVRSNRDALLRVLVRGTVNDANTGGTGPQGFAFLLNYPSYYRNPAAAFAQCGNVASSFANESKTFDEYKVLGLTVQYAPNFQSHADSTANISIDPTLVSCQDYDDSALLTSLGKALNSQDPNFCYTTVWGQSVKTVSVMKQTDAFDAAKWLNTQANTPSAPDSVNPGTLASVKIYRNGYGAANQIVGVWVLTWDVVFRGIYSAQ